MMRPIIEPAGIRSQMSAAGSSISGSSPPMSPILPATTAVAIVMCGIGWVANTRFRAVKAARSCVRPVMYI